MGKLTINSDKKWQNISLGGHPDESGGACGWVNGNMVAGAFGTVRQILSIETFATATSFKLGILSDPAWFSDGVISRYYDGTNFTNTIVC